MTAVTQAMTPDEAVAGLFFSEDGIDDLSVAEVDFSFFFVPRNRKHTGFSRDADHLDHVR